MTNTQAYPFTAADATSASAFFNVPPGNLVAVRVAGGVGVTHGPVLVAIVVREVAGNSLTLKQGWVRTPAANSPRDTVFWTGEFPLRPSGSGVQIGVHFRNDTGVAVVMVLETWIDEGVRT